MQQLRILIADDEPLNSAALSANLTVLGHKVIGTATNGEQAVKMAAELKPDLIILDIRMPGMTGPEAAMKIAAERPVAMLMLSAYSDEETIEAALSSPATGYLVKPVDADDLAPAIAMAIARFRENQMREERLRHAESALEARKLIDRAKGILMERQGMSEEMAYRMMRTESQNRAIPMRAIAERIIAAYYSPADARREQAPPRRRGLRRPPARS